MKGSYRICLALHRYASHPDRGGLASHRSCLMAGQYSSGALVRLRARLQVACSGLKTRNRVMQVKPNEENMWFAPYGRCVSSFFGMSAFEKMMYE